MKIKLNNEVKALNTVSGTLLSFKQLVIILLLAEIRALKFYDAGQ